MDIILSRWHQYIEGNQFDTEEVYQLVAAGLANKGITNLRTTTNWHFESTYASPQRQYLSVTRRNLTFKFCAAPFGENGYFFSWWLGQRLPLLMRIFQAIPFIGRPLVRLFFPVTFYSQDTATMFQEATRRAINDIINDLLTSGGQRKLLAEQLTPEIRDPFVQLRK